MLGGGWQRGGVGVGGCGRREGGLMGMVGVGVRGV